MEIIMKRVLLVVLICGWLGTMAYADNYQGSTRILVNTAGPSYAEKKRQVRARAPRNTPAYPSYNREYYLTNPYNVQ